MSRELQPVEGIRDVLDGLARPRCVASNGEPDKMCHSLTLTGLRDYFGDALFSAAQVDRGKPHPDLFLHAAREMGFEPSQAVVVEDSLAGVQGARAAGMQVFGYAPGAGLDVDRWRAEMNAAGANVFVRMADLPIMLRQ